MREFIKGGHGHWRRILWTHGNRRLKNDIDELKADRTLMKQDIRNLQDKSLLHDHDIREMKTDLTDIKDDTKWLRRTITNALIVALIGGAVAIFLCSN
ncbi:hemolysin XhlA family protein [Peribacillus frigoritolerans]|nr:hemolysin XhlA family protein [Peribacillus frigoritolerans]